MRNARRGRATRLPTLLRSSEGQVSVELIGYIPYILVVFFITLEVFTYMVTIEQVDSAARAGARVEARTFGSGGGRQAALAALPSHVRTNDRTRVSVYVTGSTAHARVTARVPQIARLPLNWTVTREAHIPIG